MPNPRIPRGPNGEWPEHIDDWPKLERIVVCRTQGCLAQNVPFDVIIPENDDEVIRVECVNCGQAPQVLPKGALPTQNNTWRRKDALRARREQGGTP